MARVTVEDCVDKVPNRFELVMLAAFRAREIASGAELSLDRDNDKNPIVALREISEETQVANELRERMIESHQTQIEVDEPEEDRMALLMGDGRMARRGTARPAGGRRHERGAHSAPADGRNPRLTAGTGREENAGRHRRFADMAGPELQPGNRRRPDQVRVRVRCAHARGSGPPVGRAVFHPSGGGGDDRRRDEARRRHHRHRPAARHHRRHRFDLRATEKTVRRKSWPIWSMASPS